MYEAGMGDLIWVVIIVGSIISEVLKARKKNAAKGKPQDSGVPGGAPPPVEADAGLREFLETLSGNTKPQAEKNTMSEPFRGQTRVPQAETNPMSDPFRGQTMVPQAEKNPMSDPFRGQNRVPPPVPVQKPQLPHHVTLKHRPLPDSALHIDHKKPHSHRHKQHHAAAEQVAASHVVEAPPAKGKEVAGSMSDRIRADLDSMDSTRRAVVLREILGPPIALR